jgi:hypothetical protein
MHPAIRIWSGTYKKMRCGDKQLHRGFPVLKNTQTVTKFKMNDTGNPYNLEKQSLSESNGKSLRFISTD